MIVKVCDLSVSGNIEADGHKIVHAELSDIEIIDAREQSRNKMYICKYHLYTLLCGVCRTRKLLQSFKADPTKDSTTETSGPIVKVKLNSSTESCEDYGTHNSHVCLEGFILYAFHFFQLMLKDDRYWFCWMWISYSVFKHMLTPSTGTF